MNRALVPVPSGRSYRVASPPTNGLATRELVSELQRVLDRFATEAGFDERNVASVFFKPGVLGHHRVGRAVDIYAVGGVGLDRWKRRWDDALNRARETPNTDAARALLDHERKRNLGFRLYKAIQRYGRWARPHGYPVQLFGPWTRSEGPWSSISNSLLHAHRDHIHVAK